MRARIEDHAATSLRKSFLKKYTGTILLLATLAVVALGWSALTPSLMGDEWFYLSNYIHDGKLACPDLSTGARPLGSCWLALVYQLVGTNVVGFHALGILMNFISALLLLATLDVLLPDQATYNGAATVLYLVFPADMTRTWLAGNVVQGTALFLLSAYFLARFWRDGHWWAWLAGMIAVVIGLNSYEIAVGVIIVLSGLAFLSGRRRTWPQRLGLLAALLLSIGFSLWRWRWQQSVGYAFGHDINDAALSLPILAYRLSFGVAYVLGIAWASVVLESQPFISGYSLVPGAIALGVVIALVTLAILLAYWMSRKARRFPPASGSEGAGTGKIHDLIIAGAVGLALLVAGYFPLIIAMHPGAGYPTSHTHHLSSVGAALFICAVLFGIGHLLGRTPDRAQFIALAGLMPLLIVGVVGHITVARQIQEAWSEQKAIWHSLFEQAPDIANGTHVLILLSDYGPTRKPRPLISGPVGFTSAVQLLYGNDQLSASFVPGRSPWELNIKGDDLALNYEDNITYYPATETAVFAFNRVDQELVQIKKLKTGGEVLSLGRDRISSTPATRTKWRWLVTD